MKSIGVRLAGWYTLASLATMICLFLFCRYFLEQYLIHGIDLLLQDEFGQIEGRLGPDIQTLSPAQIRERLRGTAAFESALFSFDIHRRGQGTLFRSPNLGDRSLPDVPGQRYYNARVPGVPYELRVAEFVIGSTDITIAMTKEHVKKVMGAYQRIFAGLMFGMLFVSGAIGYFLSRLALRPVRLIQETANHISSDNLTERIPVAAVDDEISNLARLLNRMFDRLESSFNQVRRFTAEASHELKTPLSLVRLQAEKLLVEGGLSAGQEESLQVQLEEISRLNQIIEELLFLSRAEARAITLVTRREYPRQFLQIFAQDARVMAEDRGMQFKETITGQGRVSFDPKWIRQVLLNLLANALNASPRGSRIELTSELGEGLWRVALEDEGPGVPPDQRERIFERFVRLEHPDRGRQESGSGLGLAISRSIIGLHQGRIRAEPGSKGVGLRVVFELPAALPGDESKTESLRPIQAPDPIESHR
jgi:signal transduction histidine kinase